MKKIIPLILLAFSVSFISAQEFEISTLRIGPYKIFMKNDEADKFGIKLKQTNYELKNVVKYNGETILIATNTDYDDQGKENGKMVIQGLSTKSKKFKTKSGIGIGSTKDDIINAYKNYPSYSVYPNYDDKGNKQNNSSNFVLNDLDAGTTLSFTIVNNIVTEMSVFINEGC
ncbi:hypothetical protein SAMN05880574_10997 [Chryseobacterium sp. RU37D]|uniref:hypothetical protein n=1 Tax=Chryseobacterium sp. RU37D TaxID=1907397 RepID=UPI000955557F|nr:hypothetical protein [Chryseobacterium sp. RU37D]SIQ28952.1 hypothetical protein SAMN05880574_10997 [Chryseobacterium sp. RU37D]